MWLQGVSYGAIQRINIPQTLEPPACQFDRNALNPVLQPLRLSNPLKRCQCLQNLGGKKNEDHLSLARTVLMTMFSRVRGRSGTGPRDRDCPLNRLVSSRRLELLVQVSCAYSRRQGTCVGPARLWYPRHGRRHTRQAYTLVELPERGPAWRVGYGQSGTSYLPFLPMRSC